MAKLICLTTLLVLNDCIYSRLMVAMVSLNVIYYSLYRIWLYQPFQVVEHLWNELVRQERQCHKPYGVLMSVMWAICGHGSANFSIPPATMENAPLSLTLGKTRWNSVHSPFEVHCHFLNPLVWHWALLVFQYLPVILLLARHHDEQEWHLLTTFTLLNECIQWNVGWMAVCTAWTLHGRTTPWLWPAERAALLL